jgi:hypothetical protein
MLSDDFRAGVEAGNLDQTGELFRQDAVAGKMAEEFSRLGVGLPG